MTFNQIIFSLLGGVLPALLWLWFWLKEDRMHPEPRRLLIMTFLGGMLMIAPALFLEQGAFWLLRTFGLDQVWGGLILLGFWAFIEEGLKYRAAQAIALNKRDFDEPVDALIYLITAALGFAALENVVFLTQVFSNYGFYSAFITGNLRFLGATLLHLLSSAVIGGAIAFAYFHKENMKRNIYWGVILATILHTLFNYFIIKSNGDNIFQIFIPYWILIIPLLLIFEKVKKLRRARIINS